MPSLWRSFRWRRWARSAFGITAYAHKIGVWQLALDKMSQGSCIYNAQVRILVLNQRYIDMYKLSPQLVRPGCSLH